MESVIFAKSFQDWKEATKNFKPEDHLYAVLLHWHRGYHIFSDKEEEYAEYKPPVPWLWANTPESTRAMKYHRIMRTIHQRSLYGWAKRHIYRGRKGCHIERYWEVAKSFRHTRDAKEGE